MTDEQASSLRLAARNATLGDLADLLRAQHEAKHDVVVPAAAIPSAHAVLAHDIDGEGVCRAFLSDSYKVIDNLDVLTAALAGARETGKQIEIAGCDLTERRMSVRLVAPEVTVLAPRLLRNYRSPFTGQS